MPIYRIDIRDEPKEERVGQPTRTLAKDVTIKCDMWDLPEETLLLKLTLASHEMGKKENRNKYDFRLPERDFEANVRRIDRKVIVVERERVLPGRD